jgi:cysteine desulfurase
MRSGTLNVPAIVGFGKACELCKDEMNDDAKRLSALRDRLESTLITLGEVHVNGSSDHRLPHVTNLSFKDVPAERLMMSFNRNIAVSSVPRAPPRC